MSFLQKSSKTNFCKFWIVFIGLRIYDVAGHTKIITQPKSAIFFTDYTAVVFIDKKTTCIQAEKLQNELYHLIALHSLLLFAQYQNVTAAKMKKKALSLSGADLILS